MSESEKKTTFWDPAKEGASRHLNKELKQHFEVWWFCTGNGVTRHPGLFHIFFNGLLTWEKTCNQFLSYCSNS